MPEIDEALVRALVASQFPQWAAQPVERVLPGGWENRTFRLGARLVVRLPSAASYAAQAEKEQLWLPRLAAHLPLATPATLAVGKPALGYPWTWTVLGWIEGQSVASAAAVNLRIFATDLARFLNALWKVDVTGGPPAGDHSFHRGGSLEIYDAEVIQALSVLGDRIDGRRALNIWQSTLATTWPGPPRWVHGDISAGNLLIREGRLHAVIDYGQLCVGDPACDLAIAWTWMSSDSRAAFRDALRVDEDTWQRGRAWALWKALIVAAQMTETNAVEYRDPWRVIAEVLGDQK